MNYGRIALAGLGGFAAYFILGGLLFVLFPSMRNEFLKYPAVYRTKEAMTGLLPAGMAAMFVAILALAVLYALVYRGGSGLAEGARFGALIGIFSVGSFVVLHDHVNLNIGLTLTLQTAAAYFVEWTVTGTVIGLIYRPVLPR